MISSPGYEICAELYLQIALIKLRKTLGKLKEKKKDTMTPTLLWHLSGIALLLRTQIWAKIVSPIL